jgi:DNA polymerase
MAKVIPVFADTESFWSQTHSLSKMSPMQYVMHPDTEIISVSYAFGDDPTHVIVGEDNIKRWAKQVDWSDKLLIFHNGEGFDHMIWKWRLGVTPAMYGCTLAMARPHFSKTVGLSLAKLVEHFKLGVKDNTVLMNTKGRHLCDFTPEEVAGMKKYNGEDTDQCRGVFKRLLPMTPKDEMKLIDATIRMLVEPQFVVDKPLLVQTLMEERKRKQAALQELVKDLGCALEEDPVEAVRAQLASAPKFAKFLASHDIEVPMKPSPTNPEKTTYALAKTDEAFLALQDHDNPVVAAAALARLDVKSTLLETRIEAFLEASEACGGKLPVPLKYYGGHTGRWSGWAYNPQNLNRIPRDKEGNIVPKPSNALRMCMQAPPGHKIVVADLSGIELRVNHFL